MAAPTDPLKEARDCRDLARRARRLAGTLSQPEDQDRLTGYADELERRAAELERSPASAGPPRPVTHEQQQVQQQAEMPPPDDPEKPKQ
jgi:hypothetical protein